MRAIAISKGRVVQRGIARHTRRSTQNSFHYHLQSTRVVPQNALRSSSTLADKKPYRPWLDKKLSQMDRANKFLQVELGQLGWRAIAFDSVDLADRCCRSQDLAGMKLARSVLDRAIAEKKYFDSNPGQPPFQISIMLFQKILYGWACLTKKERIAVDQMREIMDLCIEVSEKEEKLHNDERLEIEKNSMRIQPTTDLYNTYLIGLRNAAEHSPKAAIAAKKVLDEMINLHRRYGWHTKPNTRSYTYVIKAFTNSKMKDAGPEAEKVLRQMKVAHEEEKAIYLAETGTPYNANNPLDNKRTIVTADETAYSYVMQAYSNDPSVKAATKTRDLLMEVLNQQDGTVKVNFALVTGGIASFARLAENVRVSKETRLKAAEDTEEILELLPLTTENNDEGADAFVDPYNACMNAYARCGAPDSALRAESILQRLLSDFADGKSAIYPDTISFNTVLQGWAGSKLHDAPKKAEELMGLQMQLVDSGVLPESAKPDVRTFATVMTAYSRSGLPDKAHQTYRLLQELIQCITDGAVSPDSGLAVAFTAVLDAAAYPSRKKTNKKAESSAAPLSGYDTPEHASFNDDYALALQAYRELKDDTYQLGCKPDHFAFAKMIQVIGTHTDPTSTERRSMLRLVFEDACAAGEVSKLVVKYLFQVCPDKTFLASLLQNEELANRDIDSVDLLPREWARNVPRTFRHIRRVSSRERKFQR